MAAFETVVVKSYEMPEQKLSGVIRIVGTEFYVGDEEPENGNISPDIKSTNPVRIILQTQHADHLFEKTISLGAVEICQMTTEESWRKGNLKDSFGHIWEIGYTL